MTASSFNISLLYFINDMISSKMLLLKDYSNILSVKTFTAGENSDILNSVKADRLN